jgi:hypothetical protein
LIPSAVCLEVLVRRERSQIAARQIADRHRVRVAPIGDRANHDVAVGHEPRRGAVLDHHDGADAVIAHDPSDLGQRRRRLDGPWIVGHDL